MKISDLKETCQGIIIQPPTPFRAETLEIDDAVYRKHIRFLVDHYFKTWKLGDGFIQACGVCGELDAMDLAERKHLFDLTMDEVNGKVPVIGTIDSPNVRSSIELAKHAKNIGMAGVFTGPPFFDKPTEDEIVSFFKMINDAVDMGIIVCDDLYATQTEITLELLGRLIEEVPNIAGFQESTSIIGVERFERKLALKDKIGIINGAGWLEPIPSMMGSEGYLMYIYEMFLPEEALKVLNAVRTRDWEAGMRQRKRLEKLYSFMYRKKGLVGHISKTKLGLELMGICSSSRMRPPRSDATPGEREEMKKIMEELGY